MLYCETCGAANADDAEHCFACQKPLSEDTAPLPASREEDDAHPEFVALKEATLLGRYRVLTQVGTGGFGAVYRASDLQGNGRAVAVKEIRLRGLKPQEIIDATDTFNREVQVLSDLSHPNLPRIYDHFTDSEHWYLVMDFIEGQTLEAYLRARGGRLPLNEVLDIGAQLCSVLEYLHEHNPPIIFRDLKPANVMLTPYKRVYLIDFGTARFFKPGQARDTIAFGSPGYAAPEQYGKAQSTPRSDIYGLGATLHTMLTGKDPADQPFHFESLRLANPGLPVALDDLVLDMVRLKVNERPISAAVVKEHLQRIDREYKWNLYPFPAQPSGSPGPQPAKIRWTPSTLSNVQPQWVPFTAARMQQQMQQQMSSTPGNAQQPAPIRWTPSTLGSSPQPAQGQVGRRAKKKYATPRKKHVVSRRMVVSALLLATIGGATYLKSSPLWAAYRPPLQTGALAKPLSIHVGQHDIISAVACSPNSQRVASGSWDNSVQVWDVTTGANIITYSRHDDRVNAVTWSPNGYSIASGSADKTVRVWHATTGYTHLTYRGHSSAVSSVAWSPNGHYIASAAEDAQVWDARTGKRLLTYTHHSGRINQILWLPASFSSQGTYIATCSDDGTAQIWNAFNGRRLAIYRYKTGSIEAIACSPDGQYIALSKAVDAGHNLVQVWSTGATKEVTVTYSSYTGTVISLAWSPDGRSIASVDGTIHVWDAATGQTRIVYVGEEGIVYTVAWSPNGALIVSGGEGAEGGEADVWHAPASDG